MADVTTIWSRLDALDRVTVYADWDYMISMVRLLQRHWQTDGVVPLWSYEFCGGRPELALPHGFAFTWYSPLLYALPPFVGLVLLWAVLTGLGCLAVGALLTRVVDSPAAVVFGAALYGLNGYFASHFNQGHVSFAFYHLVPALLWALTSANAAPRLTRRHLAALIVASFAFFSAGLPHGLFYFYPAVPLYVAIELVRAGRLGRGRQAIRRWLPLVGAHAAGLLLALYKLGPAVEWQRAWPREGVMSEAQTLGDVLANGARFVPDYADPLASAFPDQVWFLWEYNWYVGWGVLALALAGACSKGLAARARRPDDARPPAPGAAAGWWFGVLLVAAGAWLALGNGNALSPASLFKHLPLVQGIRVFGRYQILCLVGVVWLGALGVDWLARVLKNTPRSRALVWLVASVSLVPGAAQTAALVSAIPVQDDAQVEARLGLGANVSGSPRYAEQAADLRSGYASFHDYLLRGGWWVRDCYEPLTLQRLGRGAGATGISEPPPESARTAWNGLDLRYSAALAGPVALQLPVYPETSVSVPSAVDGAGRLTINPGSAAGATVEIRMADGPYRRGLAGSLLGLILAALLLRRTAQAPKGRPVERATPPE